MDKTVGNDSKKLGRPSSGKETKLFSLRVDVDLMRAVDKECARTGLTKTALFEQALIMRLQYRMLMERKNPR